MMDIGLGSAGLDKKEEIGVGVGLLVMGWWLLKFG